jgi:acyl-coenzyme A thioesterase PaaI-like protein
VARTGAGHPGCPAPLRMGRLPTEPSLQRRYAPASTCYGCGPANARGLRIESSIDDATGEVIATWQPEPHHAAFDQVLNGGVIGTLLDCHANWTAAVRIMRERGLDAPPGCVTADYAIRLRRPTPTDAPVHLRARVVEIRGDRVTVDAELSSRGVVTSTCRGTFVAVGPDHPAFARW